MGLFDSLKNLGSAVVDTALLPVDVVADGLTGLEDQKTLRRIKKLQRELEDAYEETFDDD